MFASTAAGDFIVHFDCINVCIVLCRLFGEELQTDLQCFNCIFGIFQHEINQIETKSQLSQQNVKTAFSLQLVSTSRLKTQHVSVDGEKKSSIGFTN